MSTGALQRDAAAALTRVERLALSPASPLCSPQARTTRAHTTRLGGAHHHVWLRGRAAKSSACSLPVSARSLTPGATPTPTGALVSHSRGAWVGSSVQRRVVRVPGTRGAMAAIDAAAVHPPPLLRTASPLTRCPSVPAPPRPCAQAVVRLGPGLQGACGPLGPVCLTCLGEPWCCLDGEGEPGCRWM